MTTCNKCSMWLKHSSHDYYGTCIHSKMDIPFIPFTGTTFFEVQMNLKHSGKNPPLTTADYSCEFFDAVR